MDDEARFDAGVRALSGAVTGTDCGDSERFPRLFPISPLSTGLSTHFSLPRLGNEVQLSSGDRDGSPRLHRKARKGKKEAEGDGRTDLRRQAMRKSSDILGASREEAPEELIFL